ncbi:hypothetical protein M427DRAFT_199091 [Gonapodya prolifera JEL478]|uniref:Uncharacterized protein n=1 Tax=Gonapodya prolifera (strain JEL478) TaxID=1344416 RepID=A0A139AQK1_GONPJ|nr:hypothetical protein M427DRAFT_199091 [Gonapodya prolifera JEL478]|eukprot:KXS18765.1 hypothetical protein M427DRAFT_199091 [Gonapodya prolifera JEL478]
MPPKSASSTSKGTKKKTRNTSSVADPGAESEKGDVKVKDENSRENVKPGVVKSSVVVINLDSDVEASGEELTTTQPGLCASKAWVNQYLMGGPAICGNPAYLLCRFFADALHIARYADVNVDPPVVPTTLSVEPEAHAGKKRTAEMAEMDEQVEGHESRSECTERRTCVRSRHSRNRIAREHEQQTKSMAVCIDDVSVKMEGSSAQDLGTTPTQDIDSKDLMEIDESVKDGAEVKLEAPAPTQPPSKRPRVTAPGDDAPPSTASGTSDAVARLESGRVHFRESKVRYTAQPWAVTELGRWHGWVKQQKDAGVTVLDEIPDEWSPLVGIFAQDSELEKPSLARNILGALFPSLDEVKDEVKDEPSESDADAAADGDEGAKRKNSSSKGKKKTVKEQRGGFLSLPTVLKALDKVAERKIYGVCRSDGTTNAVSPISCCWLLYQHLPMLCGSRVPLIPGSRPRTMGGSGCLSDQHFPERHC